MSDKKLLKKEYRVIFDKVKSVVNRYDPYGLLADGVPEDEYESIIIGIVSSLQSNPDPNDLATTIDRLFSEYIGVKGSRSTEAFVGLASEILDNLQS